MKTDFTTMTDMTPAQRAKLPGYVRDYLNLLEMRYHELEHTLAQSGRHLDRRIYVKGELTDPRHEQGIIVDPNGTRPLVVDDEHTVRFWIVPRKFAIDVRVIRRTPGPGVELTGVTETLSIQPSCANAVYVKAGKW